MGDSDVYQYGQRPSHIQDDEPPPDPQRPSLRSQYRELAVLDVPDHLDNPLVNFTPGGHYVVAQGSSDFAPDGRFLGTIVQGSGSDFGQEIDLSAPPPAPPLPRPEQVPPSFLKHTIYHPPPSQVECDWQPLRSLLTLDQLGTALDRLPLTTPDKAALFLKLLQLYCQGGLPVLRALFHSGDWTLHALRELVGRELALVGDTDLVSCAICQEALRDGDQVARLPCSHLFHRDCVVPWLYQQPQHGCPCCRAPVVHTHPEI
jgi:hypothetical protein